jgi:uncharacterized repeat protein (TIGR03803 family)
MPNKKVLIPAILFIIGFLTTSGSLASASDKEPVRHRHVSGKVFKTLASFDGTNGVAPFYGSLLHGMDGNFYGTTYEGGVSKNCHYRGGCGTVFQVKPRGKLTTLYNFCSQPNCADGANPVAGLVQTADGTLYGTVSSGGSSGSGTVFKRTPKGKLITIYTFCVQGPPCSDGGGPVGGLMQAKDGDFYGTTQSGGAYFGGTVFKITPRGKLTTLHSFCARDCEDGTEPMGVLVQSLDGNFYGTTSNGGNNSACAQTPCGTVFKMTSKGKLTTLYTFCRQTDCSDGSSPWAGLLQVTDGNFYGTTSAGGDSNQGTVFKITPTGELTTLYTFCTGGNCSDGYEPVSPLIQAIDGSLYSTTYGGGEFGFGTVFKTTLRGKLTTLHSFNSTDGCCIYAGLVQSTNGTLYGTTGAGGADGDGTVFELLP